MRLKEALALVIGVACCIQFAKAENLNDKKNTTKVNSKKLVNPENAPLRTIDTLTIKHENDLGNSYFESLLAKQLSPLRIKMESTNNEYVQSYIDRFSANNYRFHLSKMLGLSNYYFPIFERAFKEKGIPQEIKYLAIIESSLNPNAISRMGATGPWQFMYATAKGYGLTIDSYRDERKDPIAASYAAADYLKEAYDVYQDWFLAIASYNCGQGNVNRAIRRSGLTNPSFWDIRHLLPNETRNYVPAFIAMHHVLERHEEYGIEHDRTVRNQSTEVIMVDRQISLPAIAKALEINENEILDLNPAYKRKVINASKDNVQRLIVPQVDKASYSNLYYALQGESLPSREPQASFASTSSPAAKQLSHRVQKGENLEKIALKHNVTVQDLKVWNNLKSTKIVPGQQLHINSIGSTTNSKAAQFVTYKVKRGDTLSGIAKRYKIKDISTLKAMNNLKSNLLKPGMTLKVTEI
ncbi:MAG TPA: LysM peptidoglycan-binding domain-containing protein [Sphingobacteriaceae bacterium]|nr:LysM peptidoglycan-binding domain-containing protein [Sphingobacteriaceae bacterium]